MITPANPAARMSKAFITCDIENRSDGTVIAINTYDGCTHTTHYDWGSWLAWLRTTGRKRKEYCTIYAHNGGGWDWLSLLEYMIHNDVGGSFETMQNGGRIIAVSVDLGNKVVLKLMDSLWLLFSSLEAAAQKYLGEGKDKLAHLPEWYWTNDRAAFMRYMRRDTELLYRVMVKVADLLYSKIAPISKLRITLPATALLAFRTGYLKQEISIPEDPKVRALLREGYVGGRVEAFRPGYYKKVNVYDFNSLYPSVMATTAVPTTGNSQFTTKLHLGRAGVYYVSFVQSDKRKLPCLMVGGRGVYSGEGVYFTPELRRFPGKLRVHIGCVFDTQACLFREWVENLYALRLTDRNGPLGELCKRMLNSLYGKFAQKPLRSKTICCDWETVEQLQAEGKAVQVLSEEYGIYRVLEPTDVVFEHVGIAGMITSEARGRLYDGFGRDHSDVLYCDTDSIHCLNTRKCAADTLGALKHEFTGEGVYAGKKLYALRNAKGNKVVAKGIRVKRSADDSNGFALDFEGLRTLTEGAKIVCRFKAATTANTVLRGGKSCRFVERKRTIRKTANV